MPDDVEDNSADISDPVSENEDDLDTQTGPDGDSSMTGTGDGNSQVKKKYDPKDPLRPRRKKARRACFACQRAHLTCGTSYIPFASPSMIAPWHTHGVTPGSVMKKTAANYYP